MEKMLVYPHSGEAVTPHLIARLLLRSHRAALMAIAAIEQQQQLLEKQQRIVPMGSLDRQLQAEGEASRSASTRCMQDESARSDS